MVPSGADLSEALQEPHGHSRVDDLLAELLLLDDGDLRTPEQAGDAHIAVEDWVHVFH